MFMYTSLIGYTPLQCNNIDNTFQVCYNEPIKCRRAETRKGKGITIPNSVITIGMFAFYECSNLKSVIIPDSTTVIEDLAFGSCYSLTSVTIGDSVTTIGEHAFSSCSALTNVEISVSVISIERYAFIYCENLTSITFANPKVKGFRQKTLKHGIFICFFRSFLRGGR